MRPLNCTHTRYNAKGHQGTRLAKALEQNLYGMNKPKLTST